MSDLARACIGQRWAIRKLVDNRRVAGGSGCHDRNVRPLNDADVSRGESIGARQSASWNRTRSRICIEALPSGAEQSIIATRNQLGRRSLRWAALRR